jgi:hypothetical protein
MVYACVNSACQEELRDERGIERGNRGNREEIERK